MTVYSLTIKVQPAFVGVKNDFIANNHFLLFLRKQKKWVEFGSSSGLSCFLSLPIPNYRDSGIEFKKLLLGHTAAGTAPDSLMPHCLGKQVYRILFSFAGTDVPLKPNPGQM